MLKLKITSVYTSVQTRDQIAAKCTRFANAYIEVQFFFLNGSGYMSITWLSFKVSLIMLLICTTEIDH